MFITSAVTSPPSIPTEQQFLIIVVIIMVFTMSSSACLSQGENEEKLALREQLLVLSNAMAEAFPNQINFSTALKVAQTQAKLLLSSTNTLDFVRDKDSLSYFVKLLFVDGLAGWDRVFILAVIVLSVKHHGKEDDISMRREFMTIYLKALVEHFDERRDISEDGDKVAANLYFKDFHSFVVFLMSEMIAEDAQCVQSLFRTLFNVLGSVEYNPLTANSVKDIKHEDLFFIISASFDAIDSSSTLWDIILCEQFQVLPLLSTAVMKIPTPPLRGKAIKILLPRLCDVASTTLSKKNPDNLANFVFDVWRYLLIPLLDEEEVTNASIVACYLVEVIVSLPASSPQVDMLSQQLCAQLWTLICRCLNECSGLIRRRGAHLMQLIVLFSKFDDQSKGSSEVDTCITKKRKKKPKKKGKYSEEEEPVLDFLFQGKELLRANWPLLFLDVYKQIEGCSAMHLLGQIWPQLNRLMSMSVDVAKTSSAEGSADQQGLFTPPLLTFSWIKPLLNLLVQSEMASVKKLTMFEVLSGRLPMPIEEESVLWICEDLLRAMDKPSFFIDKFSPLIMEELWKSDQLFHCELSAMVTAGTVPAKDWENETKMSQRSPGILVSTFFATWICKLAVSNQENCLSILNLLISKLILRLSATSSSQAIKWIVRCFSFSAVKHHTAETYKMNMTDILCFRTIVKEKMQCANAIVRGQIYEGLIPFFLSCSYSKPPEREELQLPLNTWLEIVDALGVLQIIKVCDGWSLLSRSLRGCIAHTSAESIASMDTSKWALMFGILSEEVDAGVSLSAAEVDKLYQSAGQLYTNPYIDQARKHQAMQFFVSSISFLHSICLCEAAGAVVYSHDYSGGAESMKKNLKLHATAIADYICFSLKNVLDKLQETGVYGGDVTSYHDFGKLVTAFLQMLEVCWVCFRESTGDIPQKLSTSAISLLNSSVLTSLVLQDRLNEISEHSSSHKFDALTLLLSNSIISKILCTMKNLVVIDEKASSSSTTSSFDMVVQKLGISTFHKAVLALMSCQYVGDAHCRAVHFVKEELSSTDESHSLMKSTADELFMFGRYSDVGYFLLWTGVEAGLQLLTTAGPTHDTSLLKSILIESNGHIDIIPTKSLPYMLSSIRIVIAEIRNQVLSSNGKFDESGEVSDIVLSCIGAAWDCIVNAEDLDNTAVQSFISLAFSSAALHLISTEAQQEYFEAVFHLGLKNKPHIVQAMILQLCSTWMTEPSLALPYFNYFPSLLLYREPTLDDHNRADGNAASLASDNEALTVYTVTEVSRVLGIDKFKDRQVSRVMVLQFLEAQKFCNDSAYLGKVDEMIQSLISRNFDCGFKQPAMVGTELFGEKLRCWQALCIVSVYVTESMWEMIAEKCFEILTHACAHSIRVHMEVFFASIAKRLPDFIIPRLLQLLSGFNHSQQALSSYFVIIGHLILGSNQSAISDVVTVWGEKLTTVLLPWASCSPGLPRAVAQLLLHSLVPHLPPDSSCAQNLLLQEVWRFVDENIDIKKMCRKQQSFFDQYDADTKCTVRGLMCIYCDEWGERIPEHILNILLEFVRNENVGQEKNVGGADFGLDRDMDGELAQLDKDSGCCQQFIQTKIAPFDNLQLAIESSLLSRQKAATDRPRQDLIVVASLIDKVTNLAGIARTCEIFAAKELVLSDLSIVSTHEFQSVSVASGEWMPMREVTYKPNKSKVLVRYLREMKAKGYQIIGIEQTAGSVGLSSNTSISSKSVLVVGKELEGIPVALLQEMDLCIEIPQFGITRSLNVHVSAALVIWEATKRNMSLA